MFGGEAQRLLVILGAHHREHRPENFLLVDAHYGRDLVEQAAAHEEAVLVALHLEAAAVDPQFRTFLDAELDIAFHLVELRARDHRAVIGRGIGRGSDLEALDARNEFFDQGVRGLFSDRHRHRDRHAALAGGAVAGADQRVDGLVHVGIGHHDHVVLGAAEALHTFAVRGASRIDVFGDRR